MYSSFVGTRGPTGPFGVQGYQGDLIGFSINTGYTGVTGYTGCDCEEGKTGPVGPSLYGHSGSTGPRPTGNTGPVGDVEGPMGWIGYSEQNGPTGIGQTGLTGAVIEIGPTGSKRFGTATTSVLTLTGGVFDATSGLIVIDVKTNEFTFEPGNYGDVIVGNLRRDEPAQIGLQPFGNAYLSTDSPNLRVAYSDRWRSQGDSLFPKTFLKTQELSEPASAGVVSLSADVKYIATYHSSTNTLNIYKRGDSSLTLTLLQSITINSNVSNFSASGDTLVFCDTDSQYKVYKRDNTDTWSESTSFNLGSIPDSLDPISFISSDSSVIITGFSDYYTITDGSGNVQAGRVEIVYDNYTQSQRFYAPDQTNRWYYGSQVGTSRDGRVLFASANANASSYSVSQNFYTPGETFGFIDVFELEDSRYILKERLEESAPYSWSFFGKSVSMNANGTRIITFAFRNTIDTFETIQVIIVFDRIASGWKRTEFEVPVTANVADIKLSASGNTFVYGSAVEALKYVYKYVDGVWVSIATVNTEMSALTALSSSGALLIASTVSSDKTTIDTYG